MRKPIVTSVENCARCQQDHEPLLFKPFEINPIEVKGVTYGYWATCPVTMEPILLMVQEDKKEENGA
jgi:hypothetical protein